MRIGAGFPCFVVAAGVSVFGQAAPVAAQHLEAYAPAEVPPASFAGRQFVDSRGCVFVRAGFGETVRWVPRVNRDRTQLCNYKPTFGSGDKVVDIAKSAPVETGTETASASSASAEKTRTAATTGAVAPTVVGTATSGARGGDVGAPMETIASAMMPSGETASGSGEAAPSAAATATVASAVTSTATKTTAVSGGKSAGTVTAASAAGAVPATYSVPAGRVPESGNFTTIPVVISVETVQTDLCPNGVRKAQRYTLSDGVHVFRCGGPVRDPAAFINSAGIPGLQVGSSGAAAGGYVSPYTAAGGAASAGSGPVARHHTAINHNTTPVAKVPESSLTPQQTYARESPYAIPREVTVTSPAGRPLLAPVAISSKSYPETSGYVAVFEDGRLNPYRGPRTATGDAGMAELWTRQVPARLVDADTPKRRLIVAAAAPAAPVMTAQYSTRSPDVGETKAFRLEKPAGTYIQVGVFAKSGNAVRAEDTLRGLSIPVLASMNKFGMSLVYAGPFGSATEVQKALNVVRGAGFPDAYVRGH